MKNRKRLSSGSDSAITEEFTRQHSFLKRFLTRFLSRPQDIDDVLQETYLKAFKAEKDRVIYTPKAFLFRVARNTALKELQRKSNLIMESVEGFDAIDVYTDEGQMENQLEARKRLGLFCESALQMSPQVRRAFLMRKVYGFSYKDIAVQLGVAVSTVEKHVAKGLEICTTYIEQVENGGDSASAEEKSAGQNKVFKGAC